VRESPLVHVLTRGFGPILRARGEGDARFGDPRRRSHADAMAGFPDSHWERVAESFGLVGAGAVLDVACGSGDWLPALARVNERVVATDIDQGMLDLARTQSSGSANVGIRAMPAEALDLPDADFDAVTCFSALPYLDQDAALREIARVLKPEGLFVLGTVGSGYYVKHIAEGIRHDEPAAVRYGLDPIVVAAGRTLAGKRFAPASLRAWGPRSVRRLLARHGFAVEAVRPDVGPVDPTWPKSSLGRPLYFVVSARKRRTPAT
jgi:SAM-dependent methyltransferase